MLKLESLRVFVAVAEREHVTQAAQALCLTQSAVSHVLAQLEQSCGQALFSRVGRRVELTGAGRILLEEARALLARAELLQQRMQAYAGQVAGPLRLHASQTIASYWLPAQMNAFLRQYPAVRLELAIHNTEQVGALVRRGEAGLGVVEGELTAAALHCEPICEDQMWLVVSPGHPWARQPPADAAALADSAWILREPGSGTRMECEQALRALGLNPERLQVAMQVASNEAVASAVETGMAAAILSARVVQSRVQAGRMLQVPLALPRRWFKLVRHRERELSPVQAAFVDFLRASAPARA